MTQCQPGHFYDEIKLKNVSTIKPLLPIIKLDGSFVFLALFSFFFLDFCGELFVLLTFGVQVVQIEDADNVFLLEDKLLDLAGDDGRHSAGLLAAFEEDDGRQLPRQSRRVDVELVGNVGVTSGIDFA